MIVTMTVMQELEIKVAELPADLPYVYAIRYQVFQIEQGVEPSLEFDGQDETADHILAYLNGQPVGTARIRRLDARSAKVERVAVLQQARGLGIGKKIMEASLQHLKATHVSEVHIHAQLQVKDFYQKMGFQSEGEIFEEAGIPHVKMKKLLT